MSVPKRDQEKESEEALGRMCGRLFDPFRAVLLTNIYFL